MKKIRLSLFLVAVLAYNNFFAQRNFTLYQFQNTHQSLHLNPAFRPNIKSYASSGVGLASFGVNHTGFTLNDLLTPRSTDDSLVFDVANAIDKMQDLNSVNFDFQNELFGFGLRVKRTQLMFSVMMKNQMSFFYPRDLFRFAFEGNGGSLLGERANLDGLGFKLQGYIEYAIGMNRTFLDDKLSIGARGKLLSGIYNAHTSRSQLGIHTNDSTFDITIDGGMTLKTSYLNPLLDRNYLDAINNGFNFRNIGFGLDLGGQYKLNEKLELSASVVDLGFIKWNANNRNFVSDDVNFTFQGVDMNLFLADTANYLDNFADSLQSVLNANENTDSYVTSLNTRFFVGGRFKMTDALFLDALWYNEFILGNYMPGLTVGGTFQFREFLTVSSNYTVFGRFAKNLGVGVNFRLGGFQFFTMTDNLLGVLNAANSKNWHVSLGISASIGKPDKKKKGEEEISE
jgi:hypothetical protein